jgi:hypothetical protein
VTSSKELPSIINDLEIMLNQAKDYRTWSKPENLEHHRRILTETRHYLLSLSQFPSNLTPIEQETARQIAEAVINQINHRETDQVKSNQRELTTLEQQRDSLRQEVTQLQEQKQTIVTDLLKMLLDRFQQTLSQQMTEISHSLESQLITTQTGRISDPSSLTSIPSDYLSSEVSSYLDYLENLRQFQEQSQQRLIDLDTTFENVFETIQSNLRAYLKSISGSLDQLHDLSKQSETVFTDYIQRMAQETGETLAIPVADHPLLETFLLPQETHPETEQNPELQAELENSQFPIEMAQYPFPGLEIPLPSNTIITTVTEENNPEEAISLIQSSLDSLLGFETNKTTPEAELFFPPDEAETIEPIVYQSLFNLEAIKAVSESENEETLNRSEPSFNSNNSELSQPENIDLNVNLESNLFGELPDPATNSQSTTNVETISNQAEIIPEAILYPPETETQPSNIKPTPVIVAKPQETPVTEDDSLDLVMTINLLTDLLQQGALDRTEIEEKQKQEETPNLNKEESLVTNRREKIAEPDLDQVLDPSILEQLSQDLQGFESD